MGSSYDVSWDSDTELPQGLNYKKGVAFSYLSI